MKTNGIWMFLVSVGYIAGMVVLATTASDVGLVIFIGIVGALVTVSTIGGLSKQ